MPNTFDDSNLIGAVDGGFDEMSRRSFRILIAIITFAIVVAAVALLWSSLGRFLSASVAPSELVSQRPSGSVKVAGVVVSSEADDGGLTLVVADASAPEVGVLTLKYAGAQQISFERGGVVIAVGRMMSDGVLGVDEFVVKRPLRPAR